MRLIIEAPNGKTYFGAPSEVMYFKESAIEDEEPRRCENPHQVAGILTKWIEDNINSAFTLTTDKGDIFVFPPEILKRCIITIQAEADILKQFVPESTLGIYKGPRLTARMPIGNLTDEHSSPGFGYEPEEIQEEVEMKEEDIKNETDRG